MINVELNMVAKNSSSFLFNGEKLFVLEVNKEARFEALVGINICQHVANDSRSSVVLDTRDKKNPLKSPQSTTFLNEDLVRFAFSYGNFSFDLTDGKQTVCLDNVELKNVSFIQFDLAVNRSVGTLMVEYLVLPEHTDRENIQLQ